MENKRVLIAVTLCLVITIGWNYFAEYMGWLPKPVQTQERVVESGENAAPAVTPDMSSVGEKAPLPAFTPDSGREVIVETPRYTATLHSNGGVLKSFRLANYHTEIGPEGSPVEMIDSGALGFAPLGLIVDGSRSWESGKWQFAGDDLSLTGSDEKVLTFTGEVNGLRIIRELTFSASSYFITERVRLINPGDAERTVRLDFTLGTSALSSEDNAYNQTRVGWMNTEGVLDEETDVEEMENGRAITDKIQWAGIQSNYFLAAIAPEDDNVALKFRLQQGVYRLAIQEDGIRVAPGGENNVETTYFVGPKVADELAKGPNQLSEAVYYGWFTFVAEPLVNLLKVLYNYVGNYGVAIILLTVLIKLVFWPLSHKSYKSMEQMKKLQPMMQKIREKYADDRERQQQEIMKLYKTYKVNPAGGCLPMLLQIPVFIGLYQGLLNAIELRHAPFIPTLPFTDMVWLADLSAQDPYYITPIVMGATMFLQQKLTPMAGDPIQQKMMMFMPLIFTFMFLSFPSGLVVYWLVNNVLSIAQQWWMLRKA